MNTTYYQELNLPENPIKGVDVIESYPWTSGGYHIWKYPRYHLNDAILGAFNKLGVNPGYLVFFCNAEDRGLDRRVIHTDLVTAKDPRLVKTLVGAEWRNATFGINWEIHSGENDFYWYSPTTLDPVMPEVDETTPTWFAWLHGRHYGHRIRCGPLPGSQEIARTTVTSRPTLVRADIPHATAIRGVPPGENRLGVSIRFYENWSWEEACEIFKPLFAQEK